jgi:hypothetical protein
MQTQDYTVLFIKAASTLGAVYTVASPISIYQQHESLGAIATAFIHVPLALFGAYAAFLTLDIDQRFSVIATAFVLLNAVLV